jgi:hypothetical protein
VTQAQRFGMPGAGVARAELAEQRRELPAQGQRHGDDDELQHADGTVARRAAERGRGSGLTVAVQEVLERRLRRRIRARHEHVGRRASDELVGRHPEQCDDADAALGDGSTGRAENVAAIGQPEQNLLDLAVALARRERGQPFALKGHAVPIGTTSARG